MATLTVEHSILANKHQEWLDLMGTVMTGGRGPRDVLGIIINIIIIIIIIMTTMMTVTITIRDVPEPAERVRLAQGGAGHAEHGG
jgi:hypothetical protein